MNLSCPQCGLLLDADDIKNCKLSSCSACDSSLLIENNTISLSELNVAKNTNKALFEINNIIRINDVNYIPKAYCVYRYNLAGGLEGNRVEWELTDTNGDLYTLNQEDENVFLVKQIPNINQKFPVWERLQPNTQLKINDSEWLVVEQLQVEFVSYYGALQNLPQQNAKLKCSYLSNTRGECLVLTFGQSANTPKAYQGWWLDPLELR